MLLPNLVGKCRVFAGFSASRINMGGGCGRRKADYLHAVDFIGEGLNIIVLPVPSIALDANNFIRASEHRLNRLILIAGKISVSGIKICTDRLGLTLAVIHMGAMMLHSVSRVVRVTFIIIILKKPLLHS